MAGNLLLCSLAGYAFARIRFFGRDVTFIALLATLMVPFQVIMIPTFLIVQHLGLVDSLGALIAPNLVTPFGIFLLRQFFRTLPIELEEAARIDGCSRLGVLFRIVLPLSMPALATLGSSRSCGRGTTSCGRSSSSRRPATAPYSWAWPRSRGRTRRTGRSSWPAT